MSTDPLHRWTQLDLVGGVRSTPETELSAWICNPSTGQPIETQRSTSTGQVLRAIQIADEIDRAGTWRDTPLESRAQILERIAQELDALAPEVAEAEALGTGIVISVTRMFADSLGSVFRDAADRLRSGWTSTDLSEQGRPVRLLRLPWGPTAVLVPWNSPSGVASKKVAYALAVGAPVILKANEWAPYGCNLLADAIERAGVPSGAFQLVHGGAEVGNLLVSDPRVRAISFTGSLAVGRQIAQAAAPNFTALQLELSGNNPAVVMADADISATAAELRDGMVKLNGEWCEAPRKIFVPHEMHDALCDALRESLTGLRIGRHDDPAAEVGPLANAQHRSRLEAQLQALEALGASVESVGELPDLQGWFWAPRLVTGIPSRDCVEEMFGPVVTLHPYDLVEEAIAEANDSPYGLAAYVFGTDIDRAMEIGASLRFGEVKVNGTSLLDLSSRSVQSFWRSSGIGGHGDEDVFAFFCGAQIVGVDRQGLPI